MRTYGTSKVPMPPLIQNALNMINEGQMIPVPTGASLEGKPQPFITFVIREFDQSIRSMDKDPNVEAIPGLVLLRRSTYVIPMIFTLIRLSDNPKFTYETAFNVADTLFAKDCETLAMQNGMQIVVCGSQEKKVIVGGSELFWKNVTLRRSV
jgi:hypothetical protein